MSNIRPRNDTDHSLNSDSYHYEIPLILATASIVIAGLLIGCCYYLNIADNNIYQQIPQE